ncbi:MAG: TetR/AcrR family transcriptional regulator [Acidobacteriota bacterium]|nr:TetR/AcrR family transcriptional regulator [Acidobacteriota bacterium]
MSKQAETGRAEAPPSTAGGGRMAADERRRQIVRVAMRLFAERGFRGTTTKEIAQAAGVSEAIIFRHFATKDDLYSAIIDDKSCEGMGGGLGAVGGGHEGHTVVDAVRHWVGEAMGRGEDAAVFEGIALKMMEHHQRDPQFLRLLLYSALEGHQLAQIFWDRNVRMMYEFLGSYIRRRQREGAFRESFDPLVAVRAFTGAVIHHSLNNTLWDRDPARRILNVSNEEAARSFTEILLRGITLGPAASKAGPRARPAGHRGKKK